MHKIMQMDFYTSEIGTDMHNTNRTELCHLQIC
jgi:hypothetical protein